MVAGGAGGPAGDFVEIIEVDGAAPARVRAAQPVPTVLQRWPWWRRAGPSTRRVAVCAAAMSALGFACLVAVAGARHPVREVRQVVTVAAPAAVPVDATGCPLGIPCAQRRPRAGVAVLSSYGFDTVLATEVYDPARPHTVFDRQLLATKADATVTVWARCGSVRSKDDDDPAPLARTTVRRMVKGVQVFLQETNYLSRRYAGTCSLDVWCVQTSPLYTAQLAISYAPTVRAIAADPRIQL